MKSFKHFNEHSMLNERFVNLLGKDEKKSEYAKEVFAMIQKSYESIGGQKGNGFKSANDMIANIPFWKLVRRSGKIVAGAMYRDKGGRKRVAVFTDGTIAGKKGIASIMKEDFDRAYFEVSGPSLGFAVKLLGIDFVKSFAKTPEEAASILKTDLDEVPEKDSYITKYPALKQYFYQRDLGGKLNTKIMLGTNGKKLVINEL
jgi:hypothetical protein